MLEPARVVAIHPEDHSLDVVLLRTGQRVAGVQMLAQGASTTSGLSDLPPVTAPAENPWNLPARSAQDAIVVLAPTRSGAHYVALGMLFPQQNGVLGAEPGVRLYRHHSGAWQRIGNDGTVTVGLPSGATITFGPNLTPVDPTAGGQGGGVDGLWKHQGPNAAAAPGLHVVMPSGAEITVAVDGKVTVKAPAEVKFDVPLVKLTGRLEAAGDVVAGTVSLQNHVHNGVETGGGNSGPPVA